VLDQGAGEERLLVQRERVLVARLDIRRIGIRRREVDLDQAVPGVVLVEVDPVAAQIARAFGLP
jgi:hypothetical protein